MHEYSVVSALLARVEELADERDARRVRGVWVRIGELSGVEPRLLEAAFHTVREETVCERADLHVTWCPVTWTCRDCGGAIARTEAPASPTCPACGGGGCLASGDEVLLERIEIDED